MKLRYRLAVTKQPDRDFAVVRDAFLHDPPGKSDAIIIEFGIAGTSERHFAAQKYRKSRWLRRLRTIGGLIYLAEPKFTAAGA